MPDEFPDRRLPAIDAGPDHDPFEPPELPDELIDELLAGARTPEELAGPDGLLQRLTKRLVERAMDAELSEHLGYERGEAPPGGTGNARNGFSEKTVHTEHGSVRIEQPRDRAGSFEPVIVPKHRRRFHGFDEKIVAMYARGMSVRDIQAHLRELYGVEVGHDLISRVTDAVLDDVREWQSRPLEDVYPILFLDALLVKVRDGGAVRNLACYVAIGVTLDGERDVLGLWFQRSEGAKFWLAVLTELKQRGVRDVLVCCVDGLKGFPEAIEAVFPQTWVQTWSSATSTASLTQARRLHRPLPARLPIRRTRPARPAHQAGTALPALGTRRGRHPRLHRPRLSRPLPAHESAHRQTARRQDRANRPRPPTHRSDLAHAHPQPTLRSQRRHRPPGRLTVPKRRCATGANSHRPCPPRRGGDREMSTAHHPPARHPP